MKKLFLFFLIGIIVQANCFAQISIATAATTQNTKILLSFDADYQCVLDRCASLPGCIPPSYAQRTRDSNFIIGLKNNGIWNTFDALWVTNTDGNDIFATLNWKNVLKNQLVLVNNPTFTPNFGFTGNGTSSYISTAWVPITDGVNFTVSSGSFIMDDLVNATGSSSTCNLSAPNFEFITKNSSGSISLNMSAVSDATYGPTVSDSRGFYQMNRVSSSQVNGYLNGVKIAANVTSNTIGLGLSPVYIFARNIGGVSEATADEFRGNSFGILGFESNIESSALTLYNLWTIRNTH